MLCIWHLHARDQTQDRMALSTLGMLGSRAGEPFAIHYIHNCEAAVSKSRSIALSSAHPFLREEFPISGTAGSRLVIQQ